MDGKNRQRGVCRGASADQIVRPCIDAIVHAVIMWQHASGPTGPRQSTTATPWEIAPAGVTAPEHRFQSAGSQEGKRKISRAVLVHARAKGLCHWRPLGWKRRFAS